jgi:predicted nucleic acid-binding Zn ribbon protein
MKLPRHRRIAIRETLAELMRAVEPTPFAAEGPCRAGVRSRLCLDGWSWVQADAEAALLVMSALQQVGAKRPSWQQGQPEYTQQAVLPVGRETCKRCGKPLPEGNVKYCGPVCFKSARNDAERRRYSEEKLIAQKAAKAAWSQRQPERSCPVCGKAFRPKEPRQKICSDACRRDNARVLGRALGAAAVERRAARRRKVPGVCEPL